MTLLERAWLRNEEKTTSIVKWRTVRLPEYAPTYDLPSMRYVRDAVVKDFAEGAAVPMLYRAVSDNDRARCYGATADFIHTFTAPHWGIYAQGGAACSDGLDWFGAWETCADGYVMAHVLAKIVPRKLWTRALLAIFRPMWTGPHVVEGDGYHSRRVSALTPEGKVRAATQEALASAHEWSIGPGGSTAVVRGAHARLQALLDAAEVGAQNSPGVLAAKVVVRSVFEQRDTRTQHYDTTPLSFLQREWRRVRRDTDDGHSLAWANLLRQTITIDHIADGLVRHGLYT